MPDSKQIRYKLYAIHKKHMLVRITIAALLLVLVAPTVSPVVAYSSAGNPNNQTPEAHAAAMSRLTASIVIQAYDATGKLLRSSEFQKATTNEAYALGPDGSPHYALYQTSADGLPSFAVLPQIPFKIYAIWEVPDFGKVMLTADNDGEGYVVDKQAGSIRLNFNYEVARSKVAALRRDSEQFMSQGINISSAITEGLAQGEQHLKAAEALMQVSGNVKMSEVINEINISLKNTLPVHEQLYLDKAAVDIEKYRKGDVIVNVADNDGKPVSDVTVTYKQNSRDFLFSATGIQRIYIQLLQDAGINTSTAYFDYGRIEPEPGKFDWSGPANQVDFLSKNGFKPVGYPSWLFFHGWGNRDKEAYIPAYLKSMTFDQLNQAVYDHHFAMASQFKGKVDIWDVLYEICSPWSNELKWTWQQRLDVFKAATDGVRAADPQAKIMLKDEASPYNHFMGNAVVEPLNSEAVAGWVPLPEFIEVATAKQISLDILGLGLPNGSVEVYQDGSANIQTLLDMVGMSSYIEQYTRFGKSLFARDFHPPSTQISGGNWWHRHWDEATQAEYAKDFYTLFFSKPLAVGIDWGTGIADDITGKTGGLTSGLLMADFKPKQAYFAIKSLISSWTTAGNGKTDNQGKIAFRGFAGDYDITLQTADGQYLKMATLHINEQQTSEVTINISPPISTTQAAPKKMNYPLLIASGVVGVLLMGFVIFFIVRRKVT
jgi:hypothetical protein